MSHIQIPLNNQRRYACFVCGVEFKAIEDMGKHVIEKHEEGRDYVLCPIARCGFPVRDVRAHVRARHPREPIPTKGQMRAIRWFDHKKDGGKKKRAGYKEGFFTSAKNGMKDFHYRSSWELDVYKCLEDMDEVVAYKVEPFPIGYWFQGDHRHYYPDLIVAFADGHSEVWEIKPAKQTTLPINEAKWEAAAAYCQVRGWEFCVKTQKGIGQLKKDVARRGKVTPDASRSRAGDPPYPTDASSGSSSSPP